MDIQPNAQEKKFKLTPLAPKDFELAPVTAEAFMPENLGGLPPDETGIEASGQERTGYMKGLGRKFKAGMNTLGEMITEIPQATEAIADLPYRMVADGMINREVKRGTIDPKTASVVKQNKDTFLPQANFGQIMPAMPGVETIGEDIADSRINNWFENNAKAINESVTRYDATATEYLKNKQFGKALGAVTYGIAESLPATLAALVAPQGALMLGLGTGAQKYDEVKDRDDMAEGMKVADAVTTGMFEWLFEKFGTAEMGKYLGQYVKRVGKEGIEKAFTSGPVMNLVSKGYKKFGVWFAPVHEGVSELLTTMGQNAATKFTGEDPDVEIMDNTIESFLVGAGMGGMFSSTAALANKIRGGSPVSEDPDAPIKAEINQYGEKLKFNSNVPLAEDQNPLISIASHKIEDKKFFLTGESGAIGDHVFTAYDFDALQEAGYDLTQVRPQLIKASDIRERMDIPYQEWLQQEVNQFKQTQVQGQQMVVKAQAPVQEGQEITLGDKTFNVTFVDETGITLNEIDKQGNITGEELVVPPEDYEKVFGVPAAQSGQISPLNDQALPENVTGQGQIIPEQVTNTGQPAENIPQQVQLPVNKKGEIEYDQITEPELYAQGLTEEFGEGAPAILDELIAEQMAALEKAKKGSNAIERARRIKAVNAELTKLTSVKKILTPTATATQAPGLDALNASPVVEQPEPIEQATEQDIAEPEEVSSETEPTEEKEADQPVAKQDTPSTPDETAPVEAEMQEAEEVEKSKSPEVKEEQTGKRQSLSSFRPGDIVRNVTGDVWEVVEIPADTEQKAILRDPKDGSTVEWSQKTVSWTLEKKEKSPEIQLIKANAEVEPKPEFAGESLENAPKTRSLREFNKGDHVKNIKTGNEYEVVSVPKTGDVSLKKLGEKQIKNFNGKLTQWVPIQKEIKAKGVKRTVKFGPDSQKGKLLARMPQTFKEFVLQFFVRGGRVSHADFLRYVGWKASKAEGYIWAVKGDAEGKKEQGKAFDSFWEDAPEEWGRRGGTEDTNEIADILKDYPSIKEMMAELERLQNKDDNAEVVPDRNMPSPEELGAAVSDADIEDDLSNHEDEVVGRLDDVWDNPDYQIIFDKYSTDKGLDVDKLLADINNNPEGISNLTPFGLNNKELTTLKNYLEDEQSRRKESQVSENIQGFDKDQSQDRKEDSSGSDQGNRVRGTAEEGERNKVVPPKDDIDQLNDLFAEKPKETPASKQKSPYSPIQQKQIDKINKEYSELIAKKEAAIVQAEKDMREALLRADERNGLFGDTNPVEKDEIIKRDEQGFTYSEATRAAVRKPFEEKMAELRKEIEELRLEQKGNEVLYRVIGERGATAVEGLLDYLNVARQMEKAGKSPKEIFLATGWERGKDGKWRHETRDIELKKDIDFIGKLKTQNEAYTEEVLLTDIIEDEELFNSYPELKEVKLTFYNYGSHPELTGTGAFSNFTQKVIGIGTGNMAGTKRSGSFFPGRTLQMGSRTISGHDLGYRALYAYDRDSLKSVLSHEIQHYIQRIEGFAEGTTTVDSGTGRRKDLVYKNAAGEVEARNVQRRTKLSAEERKSIMLSETEDVARDQQIVIRNEFDRQENANTVRAQITALSEEFNTTVIVVETKEDLPDDVKTDAKNKGIWNDRITGVYDSGKVYVVLDALSQGYDDAVTEARKVILHEVVAHKGLPAMLGQEAYDNLLDDIYDSIPEDDRRLLEYDYNTKDKRTIATEYLADMAENDVNPSLFQRIIAKVRDILHKLFNIGYTENDVYDMLRRSAENLRKQKRANAEFAGEYLERTQDITQTPAFKKWFGDSKVVDENGRPLVVYHGSPNTFDTFNLDKVGAQGSTEGHGFYFTADREIAQGYAERRDQGEGKLYEVYLKIENPYSNEKRTITKTDVRKILSLLHKKDPEYALSNYGDIAYEGLNKVLNIAVESENEAETDTDLIGSLVNGGIAPLESVLKAVYDITGKDGVITSWENGTPIFVTASPNQIKSATGNKGTFDSNNPNILYSTNKPSDRFAGDWLEQQPEVGPNPELLKSAAQIYAERQAKGNISETVQGIREYIQDMNLPVRKFEEDVLKRGGRQDNDSKPYRDMNLSFGRQEKLYTDYFDKKMKPIFRAIAAIKKAGVRGEEILPYVIAKHAVERNPIMRGEALRAWVDGHQDATADEIEAKRAELKDLDYSGVKSFDGKNEYENPDALARDIVKAFEATIDKSLIDNFWNSVRTATSATLDTWEQGNQISAEQKKKYLEQYRYFVPLRGWRHGVAKELIYTRGEGFSKSLQKAEGRKSLADNPLAYILSVQFQAISEQVDNEVKTSMYNLILKNLKNPEINELVTVKKLYYVKIKHADGTEEWEPTDQRPAEELFASGDAKTKIYREHERLRKFRHAKEHEVIVHKPGGDAVIVFKKTQLSTAHALNKQNYMFRTFYGHIYDARNMGPAIRFLGYMNNGLKALYTSWNVVFPFTNFMRDFQEASITQSIKQGTGGKVMVNYKGAFPTVIRNLRGKPDLNNRLDRDLQDFYTLGGATGYTHTKTIEEIEKDVNREVDRMVRKGTVLGSMRNGVGDVLKTVEAWNKVFEDATRFSVYLSSLAAGNSKQDAAIDAKEASVNFNRKGKGSKTWDAYFAFFNVALQSLQKNFKLAKDHTGKFTAVAGSFVALGFLEALMNALADDDDKDSAYYNINPYMRQNYLIIPNLPKLLTTGEKGNKYLSIPLPQFWRGFKSVGSIAFDIATKKMSVKDGVMSAIGNFASALLPVDVAGFYKSGEFSWAPISPTVLKPIVELIENKNYMGYKIMNEPFTRDDKGTLAASRLGKTNVSPEIKYVTDMLFRWGGGKGKYKYYYDHDKLESSKVPFMMDINPSGVEHLIKGYSGGTGAFLTDLVTTISQGANPNQEIDFKNMPFVNKFIRTIPEAKWNIISEYYDLRDDKKINSKLEKEAVKDAETTGDWSTVTAMYGNEYLQRYQETFASFEGELDDAMKMKDFDLVEGNRLSVEIMERAIAEIKELKREYGKK